MRLVRRAGYCQIRRWTGSRRCWSGWSCAAGPPAAAALQLPAPAPAPASRWAGGGTAVRATAASAAGAAPRTVRRSPPSPCRCRRPHCCRCCPGARWACPAAGSRTSSPEAKRKKARHAFSAAQTALSLAPTGPMYPLATAPQVPCCPPLHHPSRTSPSDSLLFSAASAAATASATPATDCSRLPLRRPPSMSVGTWPAHTWCHDDGTGGGEQGLPRRRTCLPLAAPHTHVPHDALFLPRRACCLPSTCLLLLPHPNPVLRPAQNLTRHLDPVDPAAPTLQRSAGALFGLLVVTVQRKQPPLHAAQSALSLRREEQAPSSLHLWPA